MGLIDDTTNLIFPESLTEEGSIIHEALRPVGTDRA